MLGYVKPLKAELKVWEWEAYQGIYCGLCKVLGKKYGQISRMTLSYDFVFLAVMKMALEEKKIDFCKKKCMIHPFKKRNCCQENESLSFSCTIAMILMYHKLMDNLADGGFWERIAVHLAMPFAKNAYSKAAAEQPELAAIIAKQMQNQAELEHAGCTSVDAACEPTAACMAAIFASLSGETDKSRILERMGYLLGRLIYLMDALDDYEDDIKSGSYNPFRSASPNSQSLKASRQEAISTLYMTIGELGKTYELLNLRAMRGILENVLFLGLKENVDIIQRKNQTKKRKQRKTLILFREKKG